MLGTRFELSHEACCYAGRLGVVGVCPSLAAKCANRTRLGGVVGMRDEAQMRVVVNEACDDDDDRVGGRADALSVCPHSPRRRLGPSRGALSTRVPRP